MPREEQKDWINNINTTQPWERGGFKQRVQALEINNVWKDLKNLQKKKEKKAKPQNNVIKALSNNPYIAHNINKRLLCYNKERMV